MSWTDHAGTVRTVRFACTCGCEFEPDTPPGGPLRNTQYFCPRCGGYVATYEPAGPQPGESAEALELHRARGWRESPDGGWTIDPELAAAYAASQAAERAAGHEDLAAARPYTGNGAAVAEALSIQRIRCHTAALELWASVYAAEYEHTARRAVSDQIGRLTVAREAADDALMAFHDCIRDAPP
jgi:hypothetical protein